MTIRFFEGTPVQGTKTERKGIVRGIRLTNDEYWYRIQWDEGAISNENQNHLKPRFATISSLDLRIGELWEGLGMLTLPRKPKSSLEDISRWISTTYPIVLQLHENLVIIEDLIAFRELSIEPVRDILRNEKKD